jgi:hypothetical protein
MKMSVSFCHFQAAWNYFWFRKCPPHSLALLRIGFGAFLLLYWGMQLFQVPMRYSQEGLLLPMIEPTRFLGLFFIPPPFIIAYVIYGVFLLALLSFMLGFRAQASALLALLIYSYYWILTLFHFGTSFDRLFMFMLLVFIFSGCGATFSVDAKLRHGRWTAYEDISIFPLRLIAAQITATYFGVGAQKIILDVWQSGEVLAWGFIGRWATAPAFGIARLNVPLSVYDIGVKLITAWEVAMPVMLWTKKFRCFAFVTGALFHITIAILLSIWWFLPLIACYIVFFSPEEVKEGVRRARRQEGRRGG